ncbi:MAG: SpoIIE family protein phosphatase [Solirubrobacteraceae bacterium]
MSTPPGSTAARSPDEGADAGLALVALSLTACVERLTAESEGFERAAAESRALFDVLAGQLPIGIALHDLDLRYRFVNDALIEMDGVALEDHIGRRSREVVPDLGAEIEAHLRAVLDSGEPERAVQLSGKLPRDPGVTVHQLRSFFPLRDRDGALTGVGVAVVDVTERAAAAEAAREQRDLYEALLNAQSELGEAVVILEDMRIVFANDAATTLCGRTRAELLALPSIIEMIAPEARRTVAARLTGVVEGRSPRQPGFRTLVQRPDGSVVPLEAAGRRLGADTRRLVIIGRDISDAVAREQERERLLGVEQAARRASEAAQGRLRLIADVSALLEHDAPLRALSELLAGRLADACRIEAADPRWEAAEAGARERLAGIDGAAIMRAGEARVGDDGVALVPLLARGRVAGLLSLAWTDRAHRPGREEWTLIKAVSQRIALAIDSADEHHARAEIARTLQASLLADDLPHIEGAELAAEFVPAGRGADVGGDFYDAFPVGDGAWAFVIGDVCGKGPEAAAMTALARYTLRALAPRVRSPAEALGLLNAELLRRRGDDRFITAALVRIEPRPGGSGTRLVGATGGHPAPLLLRGDGTAEPLACRGMLLGVEPDARSTDHEVLLGAGDAVVLYTDGVTEAARDRPLTPAMLATALVGHAARGPRAVAREVVRLAERAAAGAPRDDLAVLVAAVTA